MGNILVFAPHPDDDIIGCGGSINKHVDCGDNAAIVYMTSGDAGSLQYSKKELKEIREAEAQKAAAILGVNDLTFLSIADGYITFTQENLILLINIIRDQKPSVIYLPHAGEFVSDHQETYHLVKEACNRASGPWFQECKRIPWSTLTILAYEVWTPITNVSYIEDISDYMDIKLQALREHKSQLADIKYDEAVAGFNRYRGIITGNCRYAECFQVLKAGALL